MTTQVLPTRTAGEALLNALAGADPERRLSVAKTPQRGQLTTWEAVRTFLFAGRARFTLQSLKTGMRYTYRVAANKKDLEDSIKKDDPAYFVSLLRGANNEKDYKYIGVLHGTRFFITSASRLPRTSPSVVALVWFLDAMEKQKDVLADSLTTLDGGTSSGQKAKIAFWHEGQCGRCGRALTVPKSINDAAFNGGYGPECVKYFGGV